MSISKLIHEFLHKTALFNHNLDESKKFTPFYAGLYIGEDDIASNSWGDPKSAWRAWIDWMKEQDAYAPGLSKSYLEFKAGYQKSLIMNNGKGMTSAPYDHEVWESPHHPWGTNMSRIDREHRDRINKEYEDVSSVDDLDPRAEVRNRGTVCVPAEHALDNRDHFPINNIDQARNALARVQQYTSAPDWYRGSLLGLQRLISSRVHAKFPSIDR